MIWMINYMTRFYVDVITHPCANIAADLVNIFIRGPGMLCALMEIRTSTHTHTSDIALKFIDQNRLCTIEKCWKLWRDMNFIFLFLISKFLFTIWITTCDWRYEASRAITVERSHGSSFGHDVCPSMLITWCITYFCYGTDGAVLMYRSIGLMSFRVTPLCQWSNPEECG